MPTSSKICRRPLSRRAPVHESQARFLAACIRSLAEERRRLLKPRYDPEAGDTAKFLSLHSYRVFHDAAYACGFVCTDLPSTYPLEQVNASPRTTLASANFAGLRRYVHTLLRAERACGESGYFSQVFAALESGALVLVADRLESDETLYDAI
jgi:hypothetical protein